MSTLRSLKLGTIRHLDTAQRMPRKSLGFKRERRKLAEFYCYIRSHKEALGLDANNVHRLGTVVDATEARKRLKNYRDYCERPWSGGKVSGFRVVRDANGIERNGGLVF